MFFELLLIHSKYNRQKTAFLIEGFRNGFSLGYEGDEKVQITSPNLKFRGVGNKIILWNKIMKEVKLKRFAGPYSSIPFEHYIQSPVGLVPKGNGSDVRLIFHLSYPRGKRHISESEHTSRKVFGAISRFQQGHNSYAYGPADCVKSVNQILQWLLGI